MYSKAVLILINIFLGVGCTILSSNDTENKFKNKNVSTEHESKRKWYLIDGSVLIGDLVESNQEFIVIKTTYGDRKILKKDLRFYEISNYRRSRFYRKCSC